MAGSIFPIEGGKRYKATLTLKDAFGVPFRKHFTGTDPKKLRKRMNAWAEQYDSGKPTEAMSVEKVCELAITACAEKGRAPKTVSGYRQLLKSHISPVIGKVRIDQLTPAHVERMMTLMEQKGIGPQTQALTRGFLRMAINRVALKGGYVSTNAAGLADPPRVRHQSRATLEPADLEKILAAEQKPVNRAMWLFLASTGLRPSEARGLLWRDLEKRKDGWWIRLRESKTQDGLLPVPVPESVMRELNSLPKSSLYVFTSATGQPFDESNLRRDWVAVLKKAELPYTNLYQLRKLFGTLKARKVSDSVLRRLMRHSDVRTTKQFYVSAIEDDLRKAVED